MNARISLTGTMPPCKKCGGTIAVVHKGKGPHAAALRCAVCNRFFRWLSHGHLQLLTREVPHDA